MRTCSRSTSPPCRATSLGGPARPRRRCQEQSASEICPWSTRNCPCLRPCCSWRTETTAPPATAATAATATPAAIRNAAMEAKRISPLLLLSVVLEAAEEDWQSVPAAEEEEEEQVRWAAGALRLVYPVPPALQHPCPLLLAARQTPRPPADPRGPQRGRTPVEAEAVVVATRSCLPPPLPPPPPSRNRACPPTTPLQAKEAPAAATTAAVAVEEEVVRVVAACPSG
jgi:hypothetical protein